VVIPYGVFRKMRNLKTQVKYVAIVAETEEAEGMSYMKVNVGVRRSYPRCK
jgi:hypothetical protein